MKSSRNTLLLVILFIGIWGLVIFKFVKIIGNDSKSVKATTSIKKQGGLVLLDTCCLCLNYRDPFLGMATTSQISRAPSQISKFTKKQLSIQKFPDIRYLGIVLNKSTQKTIASVLINNKEILLSAGILYDSIKINKIYTDSILISIREHVKIIIRER